jgi:hypothetical protein
MNARQLKDAIALTTLQFEAATVAGKPHTELMKIYKQLKELKYQLVQAENFIMKEEDLV